MKPVSVIFLIVSVVLVILGLIMCSAAMLRANSTGVDLYDTEIIDGKSEAKYDFSSEEISKIQIDVNSCNVEIVYGADKDQVVVRNFSAAGYVYEIQNQALIVEDAMNVSSLEDVLIDLAQGDFHFKGFRYFLRDRELTDEQKDITIYISDKFDIKVLDVQIESGMLSVKNAMGSADYSLYVGEGDIFVSDIVTDSIFSAGVGEGSISLTDVVAGTMDLTADKGDITARLSATNVTAAVNEGSVTIYSDDDLEKFNYNLYSPLGTITLDKLTKRGTHRAINAMLTSMISVSVQDGDVKVLPRSMDPSSDVEAETDPAETTEPAA